jgi:hypothetical protein
MVQRRAVVVAVTVAVLGVMTGLLVIGRGQAAPSVALESGSAWFPTVTQGSVALLDGTRAARVTRVDAVATPNAPVSVEQIGRDALVLDQSTGSIRRVDAATWMSTPPLSVGAAGDRQLSVQTGGGAAWVVSRAGTEVEQLDPTTMAVIGEPHSLPTPVAAASVTSLGTLWEVETSGEVRSYRNATQRTAQLMLGTGPWDLTLVGDQPVVTDASRGQAYVLDPRRGTPSRTTCLDAPTAPAPTISGSGDDADWLLDVAPEAGVLVVSDIDTGACQTITLGDQATQPRYGRAVEEGRLIFVPDFVTGHVIVIDPTAPAGRQIKAHVNLALAGSAVALLVDGGHVWFDQVGGDHAGVISEDMQAYEITTSGTGPLDGQPVAPDDTVPPSLPSTTPTVPVVVGTTSTTAPSPPVARQSEFQLEGEAPAVGRSATFVDVTGYPHDVAGWAVDGSPVSGAGGGRFTTTFPTVGAHTVTLTVTEPGGGSAESTTHSITVEPVSSSTTSTTTPTSTTGPSTSTSSTTSSTSSSTSTTSTTSPGAPSSFTIQPSSVIAGYAANASDTPFISWSVADAHDTVEVADCPPGTACIPNFSSSAPSAAGLALCPTQDNQFVANRCEAPAGTYTYYFVAKDAGGQVVAMAQQTLTVTVVIG